MNLIRYLLRTGRGLMLMNCGAALLGGICNAGLIALVNVALNREGKFSSALFAGFVLMALGKVLTNFFSQIVLARFSQSAIAGMRLDLVRKVLAVPLRRLEDIGTPKIMGALVEDILNITQALVIIPNFTMNSAILVGGACYLGWLSWKVAAMLSCFILFGAVGYRQLIAKGFLHLNLARTGEDKLLSHFRALTEGIKELKLHRSRRGSFLDGHVQDTADQVSAHNVAAEKRFTCAHTWSQLLFVALVGIILFGLPAVEQIQPHALTGYVVTTLYLMGPLTGVLGSMSAFARADVSLRKIEQLGLSLAARSNEAFSLGQTEKVTAFKRLDLINVTHSYHREKEDSNFMLGPITLSFHPGELVFIVGGNGSGKSTLAKILTGLYPPETGTIRLNGHPVTDRNRDDYRQLFSAVFSDFYVFDSLLGLDIEQLDEQARDYLTQLHLDHKVKVTNGAFSTTSLSQGQRKRLALLTAFLEDRDFYLFDEWASDQDPQFKEVFYHQVLPELKARGKTAVVITHDDRYFHVADRIYKLDYGKMIYDHPCETTSPRLEPVLQS